jgi:hypothetical protein
MTKLSILAVLVTVASLGTAAAPAFAASSTGDIPFCSTGNSPVLLNDQKDELSRQLQLGTHGPASIDVWNGCFKVTTTGANGKTNVAFYDPDSLRQVGQLG